MTTSTVERDLPAARHAGERIHTLLWSRRITQSALAEKVGVSSSTLGKKLRGEVPITVDELMTVARLLDVEPGDLLPSTGISLPRLDSNQQPSGYASALVRSLLAAILARILGNPRPEPEPDELVTFGPAAMWGPAERELAPVVDLAGARAARAVAS